jgi:hypothetical protein
VAAAYAHAATFTVNSNSVDLPGVSPGNGMCETSLCDCALHAAIDESDSLPGTDQIILPPKTYLLTIRSGLFITGNLTIVGSGASTTFIEGNKGARLGDGVLIINPGTTVSIIGVTIQNGDKTTLTGVFGDLSGGGIYNSATLRLINSLVRGQHRRPRRWRHLQHRLVVIDQQYC